MSVVIEVTSYTNKVMSFKPSHLWGACYGEVYQQRANGKLQECYLIGAGGAENPISIWFNDEEKIYRLSSETIEDLKDYLPHIDYVHCPDATIGIALHLNS